MNLPNQRSDLFNSDLLESLSHYDDYDREEYRRGYNNSQTKHSKKAFDTKEFLKNDLILNNNYHDQSKLLII